MVVLGVIATIAAALLVDALGLVAVDIAAAAEDPAVMRGRGEDAPFAAAGRFAPERAGNVR